MRLPVWLYLAYVGWEQFQDPVNFYSCFSAINLCIHEGGHLLFRPFGAAFQSAWLGDGKLISASGACFDFFMFCREKFF
jgi:hypothetical protein